LPTIASLPTVEPTAAATVTEASTKAIEPSATETDVPTVTSTATASPTATVTNTATATATIDFDALEAASQAISETLQPPLSKQPDLQGIRDISSLQVSGGWSVNLDLDVAPADDGQDTMDRVLKIVQDNVANLEELHINTYVDDLPQRIWLWQDGKWTMAVAG
jgi:hypothetical protein